MIIERDLYNTIKPYLKSDQAIVITGMRRVGKTYLLKFISNQIKSNNKLFLDLENPAHQQYFENEDYDQIKLSFESAGLDFSRPVYIFLDEIQRVRNIPSVVKYLIDHYRIKFFLTGSASYYLKNLFSESLAGRKFIFELFPFSFSEFLRMKQVKVKIPLKHQQISEPVFHLIERYYHEYLEFGGFPQVVLQNSAEDKKRELDNIFSSYFQLEVRGLGGFKKNRKIKDLMLLLLSRVGNKLNINQIANLLKISRPTVYEYLYFLDATYFIKLITPFSKNLSVRMRKMPKVYVCDCGLVNHLSKISQGALFKQAVFQSLRTQGEVVYYQKKGGSEIDFILKKDKTDYTAYEVKLHPRQVDVNRLERISKKVSFNDWRIVSHDYTELPQVVYGFELGERLGKAESQEQVIIEPLEQKRKPEVEITYSQGGMPATVGGGGIDLAGKTA